MKNLDSLSLKYFLEENAGFFNGGVIQKIQMPSRREIIFHIRNNGQNRKFYININPKFPHVCFIETKEGLKIPKSPPMFCMQLRKHLEGAKILSAEIPPYERILEFHFSISDEFGITNPLVLAIELMGKYSNAILYNKKTGLISGCAHNVSAEKSAVRELYGGIKYIYPKKQDKDDILRVSYGRFFELSPEKFFYFTKPFIEFLKERSNSSGELFSLMQSAVSNSALIKEYWGKNAPMSEILCEYYSKITTEDLIINKKAALEKILNYKLKGLRGAINEEISLEKYERYKKSGDLILQYIYLIPEGATRVSLEGLEIELNPALTPAKNAERYYKLYSKLKSAKNIIEKRRKEALAEREYLEEVLFSVRNAKGTVELDEIEEEIGEFRGQTGKKLLNPDTNSAGADRRTNSNFNSGFSSSFSSGFSLGGAKNPRKGDNSKKPHIETIFYEGFEILIGKNNKQNDFLIRKLSTGDDIWLHALNTPSSHVIIKTQNGQVEPPDEVLLFAAKLVKENSQFKNSNKAPIIYTKRKFLKRPPDTPLGYVTYSGEKEIIV